MAKSDEVSKKLNQIRKYTTLPIIVGFGIRTVEQANEMASISEGIVIGSAVVENIKNSIDENGNPTNSTVLSCLKFVSDISKNISHN